MAQKRVPMSTLTDDQIQEHQRVIFHGLNPATWEELEEFGNMNVRAQHALRTTTPNIEYTAPYEGDEQKEAVRQLLRAMTLLLPEKSFHYNFEDPL